jgi:arabinose-5-phosphate isomerase
VRVAHTILATRLNMNADTDLIDAARTVLEIEIGELRRLSERIDGRFAAAVRTFRTALDKGRKIVVLGVGKSENIATKIVATLNSTGAPSVSLNCQNALHGDIGVVATGDVALTLSYSGETSELLDLLPHLRRHAVAIIAMTGRTESTLASNSEIVLDVNVRTEACPLNLAPTSSTTNMLALGDALAMALLKARGFKAEDFARLHPGGNLGRRLLTRVSDIMRKGERLPVVTPQESVAAALLAMQRCRAGAVVAADSDGALQGIFTHGDFVRGFQEDPQISQKPIRLYMTQDPVTITVDKLAAEAVNTFERNPIDEIVVVDGEGRVVGLVDVQDLSRAGIF